MFVPLIEMRQLDIEDRGLHRIQPAVDADHIMIISALHAMVGNHPQGVSDFFIERIHRATIPIATQVFGRIKRCATNMTQSA